jgi:hypothetical protein
MNTKIQSEPARKIKIIKPTLESSFFEKIKFLNRNKIYFLNNLTNDQLNKVVDQAFNDLMEYQKYLEENGEL